MDLLQKKIDELQQLIKAELVDSAFVISVLGIEFLGALTDDKPLRADKQSFKRFKIGLRKYFPRVYGNPEVVDVLFKAVRCNLSHLGIEGGRCVFAENDHLLAKGKILFVVKKTLIEDHIKALQRVIDKLEKREIILKKGLI